MIKKKICFLLPVLSDTHFKRRISQIRKEGVFVKIAGIDRPYYTGNPWDQPVLKLGFREHGKYYKRIPGLLKSSEKVCKWAQDCDVIYSFGFEMLIMGWICKLKTKYKKKLVYEVSDIREIMTDKGLLSLLVRWLERFLTKFADLIVVTAPGYKNEYFISIQHVPKEKIIVIENKVTPEEYKIARVVIPQEILKKNIITIGYFGLLRCYKSFEILKEIVKESKGKIKVLLAGFFLDEHLKKEVLSNDLFEYIGEYKSPDDLSYIYNKVDWVWIANFLYKNHWKWARTNRFYESCLFKKPMICQYGSAEGEVVRKENIGIEIDIRNQGESIKKLLNYLLGKNDLYWIFLLNLKKLPLEKYVYKDEHKLLLRKLFTDTKSYS